MRRRGGTHLWAPDALGLAWTVLAAVVVMAPVLRPGVSLGSFDLLSRIGLTHHAGVAVHNEFPADQILYFVPLTSLAWHQVHMGQLPLWNPYNVLGMPLAFSWQSGVFSVPLLLSYLAPVHYAYTVIVLSKLIIAGTGAYTLCRVVGLGPLSAALGGTVFELSGPMINYSGWAMTGVTCWSGWIFAAAILLVRGRHRLRDTILLALFVALAIYGGHPESVVVVGVSLAVFLAVYLVVRARHGTGQWRRSVIDLGVAGACGLGLAAPLILPGLQVVQASGRAAASGGGAYSFGHLSDVLVGIPGTDFRVPPPYLGVLAIVLAVVGVRMFWRRAAFLGLAAVAVVALVLTYQSPIYTAIQAAPVIGKVTWNRDVMLLALAVAVLAAGGVEAIMRSEMPATVRKWTLGGLGAAAVAVGVVALAVGLGAQHTGGAEVSRLAWAGAEVVAGVAVVLASGLGKPSARHSSGTAPRAGRMVAGVFLAAQSALLVVLGVSSWSISSSYFSPTPAVTSLQHAVGSSLVAMGTTNQSQGPCRPRPFSPPYATEVGIRPNANIDYGVREFAVYEPVLPTTYYASWTAASGEQLKSSLKRVGLFCPEVTTATEARVYGVSYVLVPAHQRGPKGAVRDGSVGGEELFRIPGSAPATVSPLPGPGRSLADDAPGTPVTVTHPSAASWRVVTSAPAPQELRLRLTALPGWHATIDGHGLALARWANGAMLEARVPAGRHVVELRYWPELFTVGIAAAAVVVVGIATACIAVAWSRRRRQVRAPAST
jgi:hypothetical protein